MIKTLSLGRCIALHMFLPFFFFFWWRIGHPAIPACIGESPGRVWVKVQKGPAARAGHEEGGGLGARSDEGHSVGLAGCPLS